MQCADSLRVQAYFDGEVEAGSALEIERHMQHCEACHSLLSQLQQGRAALRRDLSRLRAPPALRARIDAALQAQAPARAPRASAASIAPWRRAGFWLGVLGGTGASALAVTVLLAMWVRSYADPLVDELFLAHVRSLRGNQLIEVVSTDKHTVKPWFAGRTDVSPVVADFQAEGFPLAGGRIDDLGRQRAAVVVYHHGQHVINVFSWEWNRRPLPAHATRNGYHFACWHAGDLAYCAVSDTAWEELLSLERLLQALAARDRAPP